MGYFGVPGWTHCPDSMLGHSQVLAKAACGLPVYYCHRVRLGLLGETAINSETHIFHSYVIGWLGVGINSSFLSYFTVAIHFAMVVAHALPSLVCLQLHHRSW